MSQSRTAFSNGSALWLVRCNHQRRQTPDYLSSAFAPASSSFFLAASASALATPSLTGFGAPSTRSLASFKPRPVNSRTALMTLTLLAPASARTTVNSVCSSAAAAPPAAGAAATATAAAAAETPNFSSISLISSDNSSTVMPAIASRISALFIFELQLIDLPGTGYLLPSQRSTEQSRVLGSLLLISNSSQPTNKLGRDFVEGTDK